MALQYRPIVYGKQGKDIPSEAYFKVSSRPCRYYNTGQRCYRAEQGSCPFVHDSTLRNEAIDRQRLATQRAFNDEARASARQKQQQCCNDRIASIRGQITTVVSTINKNDPSIANSRVKLQEFYDNAKSAAKATDTPVQLSNDDSTIEKTLSVVKDISSINSTNADMKIEEDHFAVKATDNVQSSNVTKIERDHAVMKQTNKTQSPKNDPNNEKDANGNLKQQCRNFITYWCRSKDQCLKFHDSEARKKYTQERKAAKKNPRDAGDISENKTDNLAAAATQSKQEPSSATLEQDSKCQIKNPRATRTIKKVFMPDHKQDNKAKFLSVTKPQNKVQFHLQQSKLITYDEATSKSIVPVPAPEAPPTMTVVKVETPEVDIWVAAPSWDLQYFAAWASKNLKPTTATKFLAGCGRIPLKLLAHQETAPTEGPTTFHYFQLLPFELRAQIYEMAMENETYYCRIIRQWEDDRGEICGEHGRQKQQRFTPKTRPPSLLHVNRESAQHAQKKYQLTFATRHFPYQTWFSFNSDNLFINTSSSTEMSLCMKLLDERDLVRIIYLTLALRDFAQNKNEVFAWNLSRFKSLRTLTLLVGDSVEDRKWSRDTKMKGKVQFVVDYGWKKRCKREGIPQIPPPLVDIMVIDGLRAHFLKIDGIKWGMGGTREREMCGR